MESSDEPTAFNDDTATDPEYVPDKEEDNEPVREREIKNKRKRNSAAWKHFTVVDPESKLAKCNSCSGVFSFTSTVSNLKKHTLNKHPELINSAGDFTDKKVEREVLFRKKSYPLKNNYRSTVWQYFDITDSDSKTATCKLCGHSLSYTSYGNLSRHVMSKHEVPSSDEDGEEEVAEEQNSPIWAYFKCLSKALKIASCLVCKERLDYENYGDLKTHLSRKHPQVNLAKSKKLIITGEGDIFEVADDVAKAEPNELNDADETERNDSPSHYDEIDALEETSVEYLEENVFNNHSPETKRRRTVANQNQQNKEITTKYIEKEESSLDIFGKYVVSLLKKLPKHKSDRLQLEFINKIMEAQVNDNPNTRSSSNKYPDIKVIRPPRNRVIRNSHSSNSQELLE